MFTVINSKPYFIDGDTCYGVSISLLNGVEKSTTKKPFIEGMALYSIEEMIAMFGVHEKDYKFVNKASSK